MQRVAPRVALLVALAAGWTACTSLVADIPPHPQPAPEAAQLGIHTPGSDILEDEDFTTAADDQYTLGAGDLLTVDVWAHEDLSGPHVVGPDGRITIPIVGPLDMRGLSREAAAMLISDSLAPYYRNLAVTVRVDEYRSNTVRVLGGVEAPGEFTFATRPTLLAALSAAGGATQSAGGNQAARCAIIRGRDQIYWIDLRELLWNGNISLNVNLRANDVVYVPDDNELLVYVLGEVKNPGVMRLQPNMRLADAVAQAGGWSIGAKREATRLLRPTDGSLTAVDFKQVEQGAYELNVLLEEGDIIHVPRSGLSKWSYFWKSLNPFAGALSVGG